MSQMEITAMGLAMQKAPEAHVTEAPADETSELENELLVVTAQHLSKALKSEFPDEPVRFPRRIAGGFLELEGEMGRRGREWTRAVRLLEQHRMQVESAESERDALHESLNGLMPEVQDSGDALSSMLEKSKSGDVPGNLTAQFDKSMRALEELEETAAALNANFLWVRSAWEQYARSLIQVQKMRDAVR